MSTVVSNEVASQGNQLSLWRKTWEVCCNILLGYFFLRFARFQWLSFAAFHRPSSLLLLIKESFDVIFYLIRSFPKKVTPSIEAWLLALVGTLFPLLLTPTNAPEDSSIGVLLQWVGITLQCFAVLSINRSYGTVPANRGVKTSGMYRFVRHPLYATYAINLIGYLVNNFTMLNLSVLVGYQICQVLRIFREEQFLSQDPEYKGYMNSTRWRLVPGVF